MTPHLARAAVLLAAVVALVCSGCSTASAASPILAPAPVSAMVAPPAPVRPASNHVTGTYPAHCTLTQAGPDPGCTPGSVRADVTQQTIRTTICRPGGWDDVARPPSRETDRVKAAAMRAYRITAPASIVELDHRVPLSEGGSNDADNLWPEVSDLPGKGTRNTKDGVETTLWRAVCDGRVTLPAAQAAIRDDWRTAIGRLGL